MFDKDIWKMQFHIHTGIEKGEMKRFWNHFISYAVIVMLWNLLIPAVMSFFDIGSAADAIFYWFMNPLGFLGLGYFFTMDYGSKSNFFLFLVLIETVCCFFISKGISIWIYTLDTFCEYWYLLIVYFVCGKIGMQFA